MFSHCDSVQECDGEIKGQISNGMLVAFYYTVTQQKLTQKKLMNIEQQNKCGKLLTSIIKN